METGSEQDRLVDAIRQSMADDGWQGLTREKLLALSGLAEATLQRLAPTPLAALRLALERIDAQVRRDGPADPLDSPRDRLFEIMMRRYEALVPWRPALKRLSRSLPPPNPFAAVGLALALERSMGAMLEAAGISPAGVSGALRVRGLALIHADVMRRFLEDETVDLAHTMKALDERLKQAEQFATVLERFDPLPRAAAKDLSSPMLQNRASE